MEIRIMRLADEPQKKEQAARWFHEKWGVPLEAYLQSMEESLAQSGPVPAWYLALEGGQILGGLGVIENDFHERKDLAPNICAVYVEERARRRGIAGALLEYACADMKARGISRLYLLSDHTSFYERYGFRTEGEPFLEEGQEHVLMRLKKEETRFPSKCGEDCAKNTIH